MRRFTRASLVGMLATALIVGSSASLAHATDDTVVTVAEVGQMLATPPPVIDSTESAWAAIREGKETVQAAQAGVVTAQQAVTLAIAAEDEAKAAHLLLVESLSAAQQTTADSAERVGQIAAMMYTQGGVPGQVLDLLAVPSGVSLGDIAHNEAYFSATSNYLVTRAAEARSQEALALAQVTASTQRLTDLHDGVLSAQAEVTRAQSYVDQAQTRMADIEKAVSDYLGALPVVMSSDSCSNPTQDQVAATIYSQAMGLGLGEVAAFVGIGVGLGETNLSNDTDGDMWTAGGGHTSSRGVFQQFYSWPPSGTAWSGKKFGPTSGGPGTDFGGFNGENAWGEDGWATSDPRMNVAMAANMFFLGPDYGAQMGLEDNDLYQSLRTANPMDLSSSQMVQIAQQVQQFPVEHMGSYESNMTRAAEYFLRIKAGKVAVPAFQPPLEGMAKSATTPTTRSALARMTLAQHPNDVKDDSVADDGLLLIGDSLAEGIALESGTFPTSVYGARTVVRTQVGITSTAAVAKWSSDIANGPHRILVSLGANDGARGAANLNRSVQALMKAAGPDREVYWFNMHYQPVLGLNKVLGNMAKKYPNLTIVGVRDLLSRTSGYTSSADGYLHPNAAGYAAMWSAAKSVIGESSPTQWVCSRGGQNPLAEAALAYAVQQFGKPYGLPEGNPPATWDCSKLTGGSYNYAWIQAGRPAAYAYLGAYPFLPHASLSYDQYRSGHFEFVPLSEAQPGDFIFFNGDLGQSAGNPIDHVALILDPVTMMTAEAGSPVGSYSYADRTQFGAPGTGMAGYPKADGSPTMPGDPGWEPVAGRLIPQG